MALVDMPKRLESGYLLKVVLLRIVGGSDVIGFDSERKG